jgi:MFS family permease
LAALFATHAVKVWHILTLSFVVGVGQSFGGPAYSALLPTLVAPEDLANAISMNSIQFNLARIIGPTLGGLAYTVFGAAWCFTLNGVSYVAVIISLIVIKAGFVAPKTQTSVLKSMTEGIRFIRDREGLAPLVALAFCTTLFGFSTDGLSSSDRASCFSQGPGDLRTVVSVLRRGLDLWSPNRCGDGEAQGARASGCACTSRSWNCNRRFRNF